MITQWFVFLAGTALVLWISRRALRHPGCHGFYRFFALQTIIILLALNLPYWHQDPYAPVQILSWTLLMTSLGLILAGTWTLVSRGRPDPEREDDTLLPFEKTRRLVTAGIFGWVRHPMYGSLLLLTWGACFKQPGLWTVALAAIATAFILLTARVEERECVAYFGEAYRTYMQHTYRFVPYVF